jgi:hypothetical protein
LNHSNPHAEEVVTVVQDFYKALFPNPSPFELPPGKVNKYLYVEDLLQAYVFVSCFTMKQSIQLTYVVSPLSFHSAANKLEQRSDWSTSC